MKLTPPNDTPFLSQLPLLCKKILLENKITSREELNLYAQTYLLNEMRFKSGKQIGKKTLKTIRELVPTATNATEQFYQQFSTKAVSVLKRENITRKSELVIAMKDSKRLANARGVGEKLFADFSAFLSEE